MKGGTELNGEFFPIAEEHYQITRGVTTMKVARDRLPDTLSAYCAQSMVWCNREAGAAPRRPIMVASKQER